MIVYPLYLTHDELTVMADAIIHAEQEPRWREPANTAREKAQLLLRMAEYSEAADEAERAYCDLTRDDEVFELITD